MEIYFIPYITNLLGLGNDTSNIHSLYILHNTLYYMYILITNYYTDEGYVKRWSVLSTNSVLLPKNILTELLGSREYPEARSRTFQKILTSFQEARSQMKAHHSSFLFRGKIKFEKKISKFSKNFTKCVFLCQLYLIFSFFADIFVRF